MFPRELRPYAYLALAVLGYSLEPIALKTVTKTMSLGQINFWLCFFATLGMGAIVILERRVQLLFRYSKRDLFKILTMGVVGMFVFNILIAYGFTFLPVAQANSIKYIWPVLMAILAVPIMREKFSINKLVGALFCFAGFIILVNGGFSLAFSIDRLDAVLAVLGAAFCWALFNILQKKENYEAFTSVFIMSAFALLMFTPFMLAASPNLPTLAEFAALAYLGVIAFGVALAFYFKALQTGDTGRIAALSYATPFLTLIWAALILGESIPWQYPFALALVVFGALLQLRAQGVPKLARQTHLPDSRLYDITPIFSGTRSQMVYNAMKGGGSVLATCIPSASLASLRMPEPASAPLVFSEEYPGHGISEEELMAARAAVGALPEDTVIFAVGELGEASRALEALNNAVEAVRKPSLDKSDVFDANLD